MKFLMWILFLARNAATDDNGNYYVIQMPEEDPHRSLTPTKQFRVFWNVPTMQCKSKGIPFENLFEKYGILQNDKDSFRGEKISILYDPGLFPALLKNESTGEYKFRNGGVPQEGDLDKHVASFKSYLEQSIPDPHFSGVGIVDFESWRPIFRQNFGVLVPYKDVSYQIERKKHWIWPEPWVKAEAKKRFEEKARAFMQTTLSIAKQMRPKAQWGYYGFPYCFNMAASNMRERCADRVPAENDDIYWLWLESTALYPSVYSSNTLTTNQLAQMVRGRIREAARVRKSGTPILPYFWFRYHSTSGGYLSEADLQTAMKTMYESEASGFILWGSSNDVNTVEKCKNLIQYVEKYLGPEVAKYTKYDRMLSMKDEVSTVVANENGTVTILPTTDKTLSSIITSLTTDESLSSAVTSSLTTDRSFNVTSSTFLTTIDELNAHEISEHRNQSDLEYYDDDSEERNKAVIKDVNVQLDSEYFWIRPENYTHNIKKQVDDEMRRKSYISIIESNHKTTTETVSNSQSELNAHLKKEAPKLISQEDDLDKILIQSTTEDEFMNGLTTLLEKGSDDVENYESIDIMYEDVETNTKLNTNKLLDEKQDNIESQNERFGREFETYEIGSQFEDQLNEDDGSHGKKENVSITPTQEEREAVTSNILNNQDGSHDRTERIPNAVTEDELVAVLPKIEENNSNSIPKNNTAKNDVFYESTTIISIPDSFDPYPNTVLPKIEENNSNSIPKNNTAKNDVFYESTTIISIPDSFDPYPNSKQVIPINTDEGLGDMPPVIPLHPEINRNIIKSISETELSDLNFSRSKNEQTHIISLDNGNSKIQTNKSITIQGNVSDNDDFISVNESAFSSSKHLRNTTPTNLLLNLLKKTSHTNYSDTKVNPNVKIASVLPIENNYDDKIIISNSENGMKIEETTKETTDGAELTSTSTASTKHFTKDIDIIKVSEIPKMLKSKNEKKGLPKTRIDVTDSVTIGTTSEIPDREEINLRILSDQVNVHFV